MISGNTIANNSDDGIFITQSQFAQVIGENVFFDNGQGIDVEVDGVDLPAQVFVDSIDFATNTVNVSLANLPANTGMTVYLYEGDAPGDAKTPLGFTAFSTDGNGAGTTNFPGVTITSGKYLTAYASDAAFGTTEFADSLKAAILVTNSADSGPGSLRQAILDANAQASPDIIEFFNTAPGWHTIVLASALPAITQPVSLNGYADPEASENTQVIGNDASIVWVIDGVGNDVFTVSSDDVSIRGLSIVGADDAVLIDSGAQNVSIAGNFLGLLPNGITDDPNANASVRLTGGANNNTIGGDDVADRNAIAGASTAGIWLEGVSDNFVKNNYVGTVPDGSAAAAAVPTYGVYLTGTSQRNEIAGTLQVNGNVLSGNGEYGIRGIGDGVDNTVIKGNIVGLNAQGDTGLGSQLFGIQFFIGSDFSVVGGPNPGEGNVISGNTSGGLYLHANGSLIDGTVIQGNYVGTDITGMVGIGNGTGAGLSIAHGSGGTLVGGTNPGEGNLISGHVHSGISFWESPYTHTPNVVLGNVIGLNADGTAALPNQLAGIYAGISKHIRIGSTDPGGRNIISGNTAGIELQGRTTLAIDSEDIEIVNNLIGLAPDGVTAIPNDIGINLVGNAWRHTIGTNLDGTDDELEGNIISGNTTAGILADGDNVRENTIYGNTIGLDVFGDPAPNGIGIQIADANNIPIGSPETHGSNVISGNTGAGIEIGTGSESIIVRSNFIGTDGSGTTAIPNANGVVITDGMFHVIGTNDDNFGPATPGQGNVISGNTDAGVLISGATVSDVAVAGNMIGLDTSGTQIVGNQARGVALVAGASFVRIGTDGFDAGDTDNPEVDAPSERNIISGNGIGIDLDTAGAGNIIAGNYIGTDISGTLDRGNNQGIELSATTGAITIGTNLDGSSDEIEGNVISGNDASGVILRGTGSTVRGNKIGTDAAGANPIANGVGVILDGTSQTVGGILPLEGNIIAFSANAGVTATSTTASGTIRGNSIFGNTLQGIDLGAAGPEPNDNLDPDTGPNTLQNYPILDSAVATGTTTVAGTFNSTANTTFTLDFYASPVGVTDQGQRYLGSGSVTTAGSGSASFNVPGLGVTFPLEVVTATATDPAGNTSEFSIGRNASTGSPTIEQDALLITIVEDNLEEQEHGTPTLDVDEGQLIDLTGDFANADNSVVVTVNWGDGTIEAADIVGEVSFAATHTYADDNPSGSPVDEYGVFVTASDSSGSGSALINLFVHNVDPVIDLESSSLDSNTINEGGSVTLSGEFTDPGTGDQHALVVDWGDGSPIESIAVLPGQRDFSASHTYAGDGQYTISYSVFDDDRDPALPIPGDVDFAFDAFETISVANVAPTGTINVGVSHEEGDLVAISATTSDAGGDPVAAEWVILLAGEQIFSSAGEQIEFVPTDSGLHTIELLLSDGQDQSLVTSSFTVTNPRVTFDADDITIDGPTGGVLIEGDSVTISGNFFDKSPEDQHTVTVDFGDGSLNQSIVLELGARSFSGITHTYLDDPTNPSDEYQVVVSVNDGQDITQTTLPLTVLNADPIPTINNLGATTNNEFELQALVDDPGLLDTHVFTWLDSNGTTLAVGPTYLAPITGGSVEVTLQVEDDDGASASVASLGLQVPDDGSNRNVEIVSHAAEVEIMVGGVMTANASAQQVFVETGSGNDTIEVMVDPGAPEIDVQIDAGAGNDNIIGGGGDDMITGGPGADTIRGGGGNDTLVSDEGDDTLDGGDDNDVYTIIGFSDKVIVDGNGDDTLNFEEVSVVGGSGVDGISLDLSMTAQQTVFNNAGIIGRVTLQGTLENVVGTSAKDVIKGNSQANRLFGGPGDDSIEGSGVDDTLLGGEGGDTIIGSTDGSTSIDGGTGDDTIYGSGGLDDTLFGGPGDDSIVGTGDATLLGGEGSDEILAGGDDSIDGGEGDDTIVGSNQDGDTLFGGPGNDTIMGGADDTLLGGIGDDEIMGGGGDESIDGGVGDDTIVSGGGSVGDTIFGGPGDDSITGGGNDLLAGGDGGDTIISGTGQESIDGGDGDDSLYGTSGGDTLFGGPGDDTITGSGDDTLLGGVGNDAIEGGETGEESIDGGSGDDTIVGGGSDASGGDTLFGGPGDDSIVSGGDDTLVGGSGNDIIEGSDLGSDDIQGGIGDDTLVGGGHDTGLGDTIFGGPGDDSIVGGGTDTLLGGQGDDHIIGSVEGDESIDGGSGDDSIDAGGGGDTIFGGPGDDSIMGAGEDTISGGQGNDQIDASQSTDGNDLLEGDEGDDTIYAGSGSGDTIFGGPGDDTITSAGGDDTLIGGIGDDDIEGSSGEELLEGGDGDDTIRSASGGGDTIDGGLGDDVINGGSFGSNSDTIFGGPGDDSITAGPGDHDEIMGEEGDDTIVGGGSDETLNGGDGDDTILGSDDGDTSIYGGIGDDTIKSGAGGGDTVFAGPGNDTIFGGGGADEFSAGEGNDVVFGSTSGGEIIRGDSGDDTLNSGGGAADTLIGGLGDDWLVANGTALRIEGTQIGVSDPDSDDRLVFQADTDQTLAAGATASESTFTSGGVLIANLIDITAAKLIGGPGNNLIDARTFTGDVDLEGDAGNDTLLGGSGSDMIIGDLGDDSLSGGAGDDTYLFSGDQNLGVDKITENDPTSVDTLDFFGFSAPIELDLALDGPQVLATGLLSLELTDPESVENVIGTVFGDTLLGNDSANRLVGGGGSDYLFGGAGDDHLSAARTRLVYLDFDSRTDGGDHVYTPEERDAIEARMKQDFAAFDVQISQVRPTEGTFITALFNAPPIVNGVPVSGGVSQRIGFRDVQRGGVVQIDINGFIGNATNGLPDDPETWVAMSSTIASHELAHMYGVRHQDAFGAPGDGIFEGVRNRPFFPAYEGPVNAAATSQHLISSPASVGTTLADAIANPYFGQREALKLAFGESGSSVLEATSSQKTIQITGVEGNASMAQDLGPMNNMLVPNTIENPDAAGYDATGAPISASFHSVLGSIEIGAGGKSENDFYAFDAVALDVLTLELYSSAIRDRVDNTIDSVIRVYDAGGNIVDYHGSPLGAFNDDGFEPTDSVLIDLSIPATGRYFVEVDTFHFGIPEFDDYVTGVDAEAFCSPRPNDIRCNDTDTGDYELFIYRFNSSAASVPVGDVLIGGEGADTLVTSSGNDTFLADATDSYTGPTTTPETEIINQPPTIQTIAPQSIAINQAIVVNADGAEADMHDQIRYSLEPVLGGLFPSGATIDAETGVVSWTPTVAGNYNANVVVSDLHDLTATTELSIVVTGGANSPPTDLSVDVTTINENLAAGTVVGNVAVVDPDVGDSHTLTLVDDAGGRFVLVGNELRVAAGADLDFEDAESHDVRIRATDAASQTLEKTITINLSDLPEATARIGDGSAQRSVIKELVLTFDGVVTVAPDAFLLQKRGATGGDVTTSFLTETDTNGDTRITIRFSGAFTRRPSATFSSLVDGNYELKIFDNKIFRAGVPIDGDGDGTPGGEFSYGSEAVDKFYTLYGDENGTRVVEGLDFLGFRSSFNQKVGDPNYDFTYDYDDDGDVDVRDYLFFRRVFATSLTFE